MATVYSVLDSRDKNELNQTIQNTKTELQGNIDTLDAKHEEDKSDLQAKINTLISEKATKAELSAHNTSNSAHNDIRLLIKGLTDRLNTVLDSDDVSLDQMSEIVNYIQNNRDLIEGITTTKVNVADIINNLTTNVANKPLSAAMGVELKRLIDAIPDDTEAIVNEKILAHNIAGDAHEDIRSDVLDAQSDASGAQVTADAAQAAAAAAQADVDDALSRLNSLEVSSGKLDREVSTTDGIITCEDALVDSGLIEAKFYGKTVQNLWVNPSGTQNGITVTSNADGSLSVSGTADTGVTNSVVIYVQSYALKPSTQYLFSCDKPITFDTRYGFIVDECHSNGSVIAGRFLSQDNATTKLTFTTRENMIFVRFGISVESGATASGTYRVMLREATEAEIAAAASTPQILPVYPDNSGPDASNDELGIMPLDEVSTLADSDFDDYWCPPGLSSIDNVEIVTAGKNLFTSSQDAFQIQGKNIVNQTVNIGTKAKKIPIGSKVIFSFDYRLSSGSGTLTVQQSTSPYRTLGVSYSVLNGDNTWHKKTGTVITLAIGDVLVNGYQLRLDNVTGVLDVKNFQLEFGFAATGYEPPNITTTPIDLQGHSLCSLPDGIRDELKIGSGGNVVLEKRTGTYIANGDEGWELSATSGAPYRMRVDNWSGDVENILFPINGFQADRLPKYPVSPNVSSFVVVNGRYQLYAARDGIQDASAFSGWLESNPMKVIYSLATPQTISLGTITPPRLPSSTSHVWINGTANTTNFSLPVNDLSVRYWLPNGELVADIYENGATDEMSDDEIIAIWNGATGDIAEASNADIEAIFED